MLVVMARLCLKDETRETLKDAARNVTVFALYCAAETLVRETSSMEERERVPKFAPGTAGT